jgi:hypothetical protein
LRIAKRAERPEKFARRFAHRRPSWVGIDFLHGRRNRTASAHGHAKIVDGVGAG